MRDTDTLKSMCICVYNWPNGVGCVYSWIGSSAYPHMTTLKLKDKAAREAQLFLMFSSV